MKSACGVKTAVGVFTIMGFFTGCAFAEPSEVKSDGKEIQMNRQRSLKQYNNADAISPDGLDNDVDDTIAFQSAISDGPGIVFVPPGFYRCGNINIPSGVMLMGAGPATVIRSNGAKQIFKQSGNNWRIRDLVLDGEAGGNWQVAMGDPKGGWQTQKDLGCTGLLLRGCSEFQISGIIVRNFSGVGIQIEHTARSSYCRWATQGHIYDVVASGNYIGLRFDERAEYINASMLTCQGNVIGCVVNAGNVKVTDSNFTNNKTGMVIEDKDNGSHGNISGCFLNHNELSLLCRNVKLGMTIANCCFFGPIRIEDSVGVNIANSIMGSGVTVTGEGANRIAGNYFVENSTMNISTSTIVSDNFTEKGLHVKVVTTKDVPR